MGSFSKVRVTAEIGGDVQGWRTVTVDGVRPDGSVLDLVIPDADARGGTVVAEVVSAEDGRPVLDAGAWILCGAETRSSGSDASAPGIVTLRAVGEGRWDVEISARERLPATTTVSVRDGETNPPLRPDAAMPSRPRSRRTTSRDGSSSLAWSAAQSPVNPPPTTTRSARWPEPERQIPGS